MQPIAVSPPDQIGSEAFVASSMSAPGWPSQDPLVRSPCPCRKCRKLLLQPPTHSMSLGCMTSARMMDHVAPHTVLHRCLSYLQTPDYQSHPCTRSPCPLPLLLDT